MSAPYDYQAQAPDLDDLGIGALTQADLQRAQLRGEVIGFERGRRDAGLDLIVALLAVGLVVAIWLLTRTPS